jgi:hypothetical protein
MRAPEDTQRPAAHDIGRQQQQQHDDDGPRPFVIIVLLLALETPAIAGLA